MAIHTDRKKRLIPITILLNGVGFNKISPISKELDEWEKNKSLSLRTLRAHILLEHPPYQDLGVPA